MNWLIGFIALFIGMVLSGERWLLGGASGFFIGWLLASMGKMRSRLDGFEAELMQARDAFRKMTAERDQLSSQLKSTPAPTRETAPVTENQPQVLTPESRAPVVEKPIATPVDTTTPLPR